MAWLVGCGLRADCFVFALALGALLDLPAHLRLRVLEGGAVPVPAGAPLLSRPAPTAPHTYRAGCYLLFSPPRAAEGRRHGILALLQNCYSIVHFPRFR